MPKAKKDQDVVVLAIDEAKRATGDLIKLVKTAKKRFDKADAETKKKVIAGVAAAAGLLAAMRKVHKIRKNWRKRKKVM